MKGRESMTEAEKQKRHRFLLRGFNFEQKKIKIEQPRIFFSYKNLSENKKDRKNYIVIKMIIFFKT